MEMREDLVSNTIAATLTNLPNATIAPYRLSFFYVEVGEGDSKKGSFLSSQKVQKHVVVMII